jgi:hypothetical protein
VDSHQGLGNIYVLMISELPKGADGRDARVDVGRVGEFPQGWTSGVKQAGRYDFASRSRNRTRCVSQSQQQTHIDLSVGWKTSKHFNRNSPNVRVSVLRKGAQNRPRWVGPDSPDRVEGGPSFRSETSRNF